MQRKQILAIGAALALLGYFMGGMAVFFLAVTPGMVLFLSGLFVVAYATQRR